MTSNSFKPLRAHHTHKSPKCNLKLGFCTAMIASQPFAKTLCSICFEDLKPIVEDLQAISICGHVFHELCLQQWFEYCLNGKKKCPICKQTCSASNVSRLYFNSVGDLNDPNLSRKLIHKGSEELKLEVTRLKEKLTRLSLALESREIELKNLNDELSVCKEQLKNETSSKKEAMEEKRKKKYELNLKTQELVESRLMRRYLEEKNNALSKELKALKSVAALDTEDDEIQKPASSGTEPHSKEKNDAKIKEPVEVVVLDTKDDEIQNPASSGTEPHSKEKNDAKMKELVDKLVECLVDNNKKYKELMTKCNDEARSLRELTKAKEKLEDLINLKKKILKMRTVEERRNNEVLRAPKASKTTKDSPSVVNEAGLTRNGTCTDCTPQDATKEPDVLRKTKRQRVNENITRSSNKDGVSSYILIDDDTPEVSISPKSASYASVPQPTKRVITDDEAFVHDIGQDKHLSNITNDVSLPDRSYQEPWFSAGLLDSNGKKRHLGTWCKKGQNKGSNASSMSTQSLFSAKSGKLGINNFFGEAGQ